MPKRFEAETSVNRQIVVAVVERRVLHLNLLGCEYSYSVIFVIIVFAYTGAVIGLEPAGAGPAWNQLINFTHIR